jgi:hypothetical protein
LSTPGSILAQDAMTKPSEIESKVYTEKDLLKVELAKRPTLDPNGEYQVWLNKNEPAPYDGIQLNPEAIAHILSEYLAQQERAEAALAKQREADLDVLRLETDKHKLELKTFRSRTAVKINGQERENERLRSINTSLRKDKSNFWDYVLYFTIGAAAGSLTALAVTAIN